MLRNNHRWTAVLFLAVAAAAALATGCAGGSDGVTPRPTPVTVAPDATPRETAATVAPDATPRQTPVTVTPDASPQADAPEDADGSAGENGAGRESRADATPAGDTPDRPRPGPGTRISWQGGEWFTLGVNVAWYNWGCDFGCGSDGDGASAPDVQAVLRERFASLPESGIHLARWWVFPGEPWQLSGSPLALDPAVYEDFDAALALAEAYDLYYVFVLFSGPSALPAEWLTDAGQRRQLADALAPLFARYRDNPRLLAWEVFNEPEFDVINGLVDEAHVVETTRAIVDSIHANSGAYATVGSAMLSEGIDVWLDVGLDFYQVHWYDYMQPATEPADWCVRCWDYATAVEVHGIDAPMVIGEFYAGPDVDALQRWRDWYSLGYAGGWAWSLFPEKTFDGMAIDLAAAAEFAEEHADIGPSSD